MTRAKDWSRETSLVLERITDGDSLRAACSFAGMPHGTFLRRVREDRALAAEYELARQMRADVHFEGIYELEQKVLEGELAPDRFRAVMDARKWRLARMQPKAYGEKASVEHSSPDGSMTPQAGSVIVSAIESLRTRYGGDD